MTFKDEIFEGYKDDQKKNTKDNKELSKYWVYTINKYDIHDKIDLLSFCMQLHVDGSPEHIINLLNTKQRDGGDKLNQHIKDIQKQLIQKIIQ